MMCYLLFLCMSKVYVCKCFPTSQGGLEDFSPTGPPGAATKVQAQGLQSPPETLRVLSLLCFCFSDAGITGMYRHTCPRLCFPPTPGDKGLTKL
jgi:hypothetical protein